VADVLRIAIVVAFAILAILLPTAIRVHARDERRSDARLLAWTIWSIYAAGIATILHHLGEPIRWDTMLLRLVSITLGFLYIGRNISRRRQNGRH
jgi:hypothetical protein